MESLKVTGFKFSIFNEMKNIIISIFAVLISIQCFAQSSEKLIIDETAKTIFTATELKGIGEMIRYVDDAVSNSVDATDINQAYHAFFDQLGEFVKKGEIYPSLFKDSIKFEYLETIDKTAFDAIWRIDDSVRKIRYKDSILTDVHGFKILEINIQGKYLNYLKAIGKTDSYYESVYNTFEIAGDMPIATHAWFPMHHKEFDFSLFKDRLWATVLLLRFGDPIEEKVERYLKEKNN